jgi:hypothetical protein
MYQQKLKANRNSGSESWILLTALGEMIALSERQQIICEKRIIVHKEQWKSF